MLLMKKYLLTAAFAAVLVLVKSRSGAEWTGLVNPARVKPACSVMA